MFSLKCNGWPAAPMTNCLPVLTLKLLRDSWQEYNGTGCFNELDTGQVFLFFFPPTYV